MTATTHGIETTPILAACQCGNDPELQLLRDLINNGMGQIEASRIAFGSDPGPHAGGSTWSTWARVEARRAGNELRRRLGMPVLPLVEAVRR